MKRKCILLLILIVLIIQVSLVQYKFTNNLQELLSRNLSVDNKLIRPLFFPDFNASDLSQKVSVILLSDLEIPTKNLIKKEKVQKSVDKQKKINQ